MHASIGRALIRQRWWVIAVACIFWAATAWGVLFLKATSDNRVFFSDKNPQLKALEAFEDTYTRDENAFVAVEAKEGDLFTPETLAAIEQLTEAAWQIPYSRRVDSITNFQHTWAEGDDLVVENLVQDASQLSLHQVERIRKIALSEPLLVHRLISPSGKVTGINVTTAKPGKTPEENIEVAQYVTQMTQSFRGKYPDLNVYVTGGVMLDHAFLEATEKDMGTLVPIMFLIMAAATAMLIRSLSGTFVTLLIILASTLTAMGLAGWYGIDITPATAVAPVIILTLAVADSIHLLSTMLYEMRFGRTKHEALIESLRINLYPIFLTSITTAIGFLSMNFSEVPPLRELGNLVAVGVTAAFFYSIFLLPALMSLLPVRSKATAERGCLVCDSFGDFVVNRRKPLFWGMVAFMLLLAGGLPQIEFSDDFLKYFDKSFIVRTDSDFVIENLTGLDVIEHSLDSGQEGGIATPDYLAKVEEFARWYRQQPEVTHVNSIADIMKRLNYNMHGDDPAYYKIPENRELAAQYLLLYEMSLPYGLDLNSQINLDKSASRFTVLLRESSTAEQLELEQKGNAWLEENFFNSRSSAATGLTLIWAHISKRNIESLLTSAAVALILISTILIFAFRSLKIGLISLLPNLLPALMAFGLWGLLVGRVNLGVSVVVAMSLGIVVDDTVHFLSKYLRARRKKNLGAQQAVLYSFTTVGMAIITTSIVLFAGFMVLTLSGFGMNSGMGLLTAIAIGFALLADFVFLPPLLMKTGEVRA